MEDRYRVFFDIDGVLAEFRESSYQELLSRGYFLDLKPQQEVIDALELLARDPSLQVYVLSAFLEESLYALEEKKIWVARHIPAAAEGLVHCIYLPCGSDKAAAVPGGIRPKDILVDDYNLNLNSWAAGGIAIKLLNGINNRHGSWKGLTAGRDAAQIRDVVYKALAASS